MRLSKILLAMAVTTSLVTTALAFSAGSAAAGGRITDAKRVVFIVPGQQLYNSGEMHQATYRALDEALSAAGYETHFVDAPGKMIAADAELIADSIRSYAAGADSVGVIAHSAGGLSSRYYAKFLGGSEVVDSFVAIGAPQYGSPGGCVQALPTVTTPACSPKFSPSSMPVRTLLDLPTIRWCRVRASGRTVGWTGASAGCTSMAFPGPEPEETISPSSSIQRSSRERSALWGATVSVRSWTRTTATSPGLTRCFRHFGKASGPGCSDE